MKLALIVCVALLAVLLQAEHEMSLSILQDDTRITNGKPATPRQFPYMAYVWSTNSSGGKSRECSGSLITRTAVLTAAHCVSDYTQYTVRLGSIYRTAEDKNTWTEVSLWALIHPKYNEDNCDNNIAIIHLPRQAPQNEFIQPVSLPSSPNASSYTGRQGIVSGWGYTSPGSGMSDVLRWTEVIVIPNEYCKKFHTTAEITDRNLCGGSFNSTPYRYDGGAPLVLKNSGHYVQIGLFTWTTTLKYNTSTVAIYTRITSFIEWIKSKTQSD